MKKILFILALLLSCFASNAQFISNRFEYRDKFDDVIKKDVVKTLITKTDSTFVFETKGHRAVEYWIINYCDYASVGDKDNIVDLTGESIVYGYENTWCVIRKETLARYKTLLARSYFADEEEYKEIRYEISKYWLFITQRVISKYSYKFEYENQYIWIGDGGANDNRIILGRNIQRIIYYF